MANPEPRPRGRRPGAIPRTTCGTCGRDCAKRKNGRPFRHQRLMPNGAIAMSLCPGGEQLGRGEVGSVRIPPPAEGRGRGRADE